MILPLQDIAVVKIYRKILLSPPELSLDKLIMKEAHKKEKRFLVKPTKEVCKRDRQSNIEKHLILKYKMEFSKENGFKTITLTRK